MKHYVTREVLTSLGNWITSGIVGGPFGHLSDAESFAVLEALHHDPSRGPKTLFSKRRGGWVGRNRVDGQVSGFVYVYKVRSQRTYKANRKKARKPPTPGRVANAHTIDAALAIAMKALSGVCPAPNEELQRRIRGLLNERCRGWDIKIDETGRWALWDDPLVKLRKAEDKCRALSDQVERAKFVAPTASEPIVGPAPYRWPAPPPFPDTVPKEFRWVLVEGQRWFVTADVIKVVFGKVRLDRDVNTYAVVRRLREDTRLSIPRYATDAPGLEDVASAKYGIALLSEAGLIALILRSDRRGALPYHAWAMGREP